MVSCQLHVRVESLRRIFGNESFRLLNVLLAEEELTIEVAKVDGVKIDYVYFSEAC